MTPSSLTVEETREIRPEVWQKAFALIFFGFVALIGAVAFTRGVLGGAAFARSVLGDWFRSFSYSYSDTNQALASFLAIGALVCGGCLFYIVSIWRYRIFFDENGIGQTTAFKMTFVRWREIASVRREPLRNTNRPRSEPVFFDESRRELLRPVVVGLQVGTDDERMIFWHDAEAMWRKSRATGGRFESGWTA